MNTTESAPDGARNGISTLRQTTKPSNGGGASKPASGSASTTRAPKSHRDLLAPLPMDRLWNATQAAQFFGVKLRTFDKLRAGGKVPTAIVVGPRQLR